MVEVLTPTDLKTELGVFATMGNRLNPETMRSPTEAVGPNRVPQLEYGGIVKEVADK